MDFFSKKNEIVNKRADRREKSKKNRMFIIRKRQVAAASLILLIGIAGYLNMAIKDGNTDPNVSVMYNEAAKRLGEAKMVNSTENVKESKDDGAKNNANKVEDSYFTSAKLSRETKRGESIEMLSEILNSQEADKESKENAQKQIAMLAKFTECETQAENTIKAKGYGECVVFMGENVTNVALKSNGLNEIDAAVIVDIVAQSGNLDASKIKIVEIKP